MLVGIGLVSVFFAYTRLTAPWLNVERKTIISQHSLPQEKSQIFAEKATKWFREDPWVQNANARFRDGGRLLWFRDYELENDNRSISISPVAFLWEQEGEEVPVTATADSAQLNSSTRFDFQEAKFGKIVSGFLSGDVRITGPDGLRIEGRGFHISEDAMKVWTSQPVKFAWGTHSGRAESGAEIELLSSAESDKAGLMAVNDVQRIRLRGRVDCQLSFHDEDSIREPIRLKVNAANGFEYFVPTNEATFSGFVDRKANMDNQVLIERPAVDGALDRLYCSKLMLQFQPKIQNASRGKPSGQLELARIIAEGQPVEFWTFRDGKEQAYANMGMLKYHLEEHLLELTQRIVAASGQHFPAEVHQGGTRLSSGHVLVAMNEDNEVRTVECRGPGRIVPSNRTEREPQKKILGATWKDSLLMFRGEEPRITLSGEARVVQAGFNESGKLHADLSLSSNVIDMYLENTLPENAADSDSAAFHHQAPVQELNIAKMRPRQMVASGNVIMTADGLSGTAQEKLTVTFQHNAESQGAPSASEMPSDTRSVNAVSKTTSQPKDRLSGTTTFHAETVEAVVKLADSEQPQFQDVWLKGFVEVTHKGLKKNGTAAEQQDFTANGNMLFAAGGFRENTEISLFGDPATVVNSSRRIEGQRIDLTQMKALSQNVRREARVEGSGRIRFVSKTGLNGKPLSRPSPVDIYWGDHMSFSDRTAHFVGNVRAVMNNETDHDVELTCAGMKVHFSEAVKLEPSGKADEFKVSAAEDSQSTMGNIERIECESRVVVEIEIMENGVVTAHHYAEFSDLEFNSVTGDFHATGPGLIESVQPDKGKRKLAVSNRTIARSNSPAKASEAGYSYIRADFIGELTGNRDAKFVRLKQHIRGVFGPVRQLTDRLNIDGLTAEALPENTGALECENLSISVIPGATPEQDSFSLVAESNSSESGAGTRSPCRFESKLFSGLADKIKYDHSKQQFILLADEGRQATVSYQREGGERQVLNGGRFEYYNDRPHILANQITGVQSTGGLTLD